MDVEIFQPVHPQPHEMLQRMGFSGSQHSEVKIATNHYIDFFFFTSKYNLTFTQFLWYKIALCFLSVWVD